MINLSQLAKTTGRGKKRIGRGRGSGKGGHTVGRGQKGQKSRSRIALTFAGTKIKKSLLKRLPLWRGKGKLKPQEDKPQVVNLKYLNLFPSNATVDIEALISRGILSSEALNFRVKILGEGELEKKLTVALPVSKGAKEKIEKAGGRVIDAKTQKAKKTKHS